MEDDDNDVSVRGEGVYREKEIEDRSDDNDVFVEG